MASLDDTKAAFDAAVARGDYSGAYAVANAAGYNNNEIAGYVNQKYGANMTPDQVGAYQTGVNPTSPIKPSLPTGASNGTYNAADISRVTGIGAGDLNDYRLNSVPSSVYQAAAPNSIQGMFDARNAYWNSPDMTVGHMASPTWNTEALALDKQAGVVDPKTGLRFVRSAVDNNYRVMNQYGASVDNFEGLTGSSDQEFANRGYDPAILAKLRNGQFDNLNWQSTDPLQQQLLDYRSGSGRYAQGGANASGSTNAGSGSQPYTGGSSGGPGGGGLGFGSMPGYMPMQTQEAFINNPYLQSQLQNVMELQDRNLQQNIFPSIRSGATSAGQYGGSRQGIAEGIAMQNADLNTRSTMAGLLGGAYETAQNRLFDANKTNSLNYGNQYQFNQSLANNVQNSNLNRQLQGVQMGQNAYTLGTNAINSGLGIGNQMYQRPWDIMQQSSSIISPISGQGATQTVSNQGNRLAGMMGGASAGLGLYNQMFGNGGTGYGGTNPAYGDNTLGNGLTYGSGNGGLTGSLDFPSYSWGS
jgi:hypothetical protein